MSAVTSFESHPAAPLPRQRHTSFAFLKRQKSGDLGNRSFSAGARLIRKKALVQEEIRQQQDADAAAAAAAALLPPPPPTIPSVPHLPSMTDFAHPDRNSAARPDSALILADLENQHYTRTQNLRNPHLRAATTMQSPSARLPVRASPQTPYASASREKAASDRDKALAQRSRLSYGSSFISELYGSGVNSPRRIRRRKDPTPFNILILGTKSSGKTSFIDFLKSSLLASSRRRAQTPESPEAVQRAGSLYTSHYVECELDGERTGVTLWDSPALEANVVDIQLRGVASFVEAKFEETFNEEQKVMRASRVQDTHIHCVFLLLDPVRLDATVATSRAVAALGGVGFTSRQPPVVNSLDEALDLQVLRTLKGKTTVVPIISKADTVTAAHMAYLKRCVWSNLKQAKLDPLEALDLDDIEEEDVDDASDYGNDDSTLGTHEQGVAELDGTTLASPPYRDVAEKHLDGPERESSSSYSGSHNTDLRRRSAYSNPAPPVRAPPTGPHSSRGQQRSTSVTPDSSAHLDAQDSPPIPFSVISPDMHEPGVIGRAFPWGFADPHNPQHCDFPVLKESVFSDWRDELREASRERWYEAWRTSRLKRSTSISEYNTPKRATAARRSARYSSNGSGYPRVVSAGNDKSSIRSPSRGSEYSVAGAGMIGQAVSTPQVIAIGNKSGFTPDKALQSSSPNIQQQMMTPISESGSPALKRGLYRGAVTYQVTG